METTSISRVNFFNGEALLTRDFQDEQAYHMEMRRQLSQGLLKPGILRGLEVEWKYANRDTVTVGAGTALDCEGRLIVLTEAIDCPLGSKLIDGKQNFLTISYGETSGDLASPLLGGDYKRIVEAPQIDCKPDYDPDGPDLLLAVVGASGGAIVGVYYWYGQYSRQHVSAVVQSVQFVDGRDDGEDGSVSAPAKMSIGATSQGTLGIDAPNIELNGAVTANALTGTGSFNGIFDGTFVGDGAGLKNVPISAAAGYWKQNEDLSLVYTKGNVGVNVVEPTAVLSVGQPVHAEIGVGLVTAISNDNGQVTLQGYQTDFTPDLEGKILQFGVVLQQEAAIASVDTDESLTLVKSFALGLGPTKYGYKSGGSGSVTAGKGSIIADGAAVTGSGADFKATLQQGDVLVIDRFVPHSTVSESAIANMPPRTDTQLTLTEKFSDDVTNSGYMYSTDAGRWVAGAGTISSSGTAVSGVGTKFTELPDGAMLRAVMSLDIASVPQTWQVDSVDPSQQQLTMHKVSIDEGSPVVPMLSAFAVTTSQLMQVGGGGNPGIAPALTVVQNGGQVPNTVAINVDGSAVKIDHNYALQVNGPASFGGGSLEVDGDLTVDGNLTVTETATIDEKLTASGGLTVAKGASTDSLSVSGLATIHALEVTDITAKEIGLKVDGAATISTLEVTNTTAGEIGLAVDGLAAIKTLQVTDTAPNEIGLKVDGMAAINTLEVTNTKNGETGLTVDGSAKISGSLTVEGIPLHTSLLLKLTRVSDTSSKIHHSLHA